MTWEDDIRVRFPDWGAAAPSNLWPAVRAGLQIGQAVCGTVISRAPFGVWLDIGIGFPALLLVPNMRGAKLRRITFDDYPAIGAKVEGCINALGDRGEIGVTQERPGGDPWHDHSEFAVGMEFVRPVERVMAYGYFFELKAGVSALLRLDQAIGQLRVGDTVRVRVESVDSVKRKVEVSQVQASPTDRHFAPNIQAINPISCQQSREIDRRAVAEYGMSSLVLMENAGRGVADKLCELGIRGRVVIACGKGNNGGDGFVIARHLDLRGYAVKVLLWADLKELTGDAAANYQIVALADIPQRIFGRTYDEAMLAAELADADWIVDALLGTGTQGEPRPPLDRVIAHLNRCSSRKLAVDLPSGLDADSGLPANNTFRADHTCTFVAPKIGFLKPTALPFLGQVHILDIGAPRKLVRRLSEP